MATNSNTRSTAQSPLKAATVTRKPSGKQRILEAAETLFANQSFPNVSAAEIARQAGVAHGLLFHHFGSMEELYCEVTLAAANRMDELQLAAFRGRTAREQITSFLKAHMRAVKQREGDAVFRSQSFDATERVASIWEDSRQRAIDRIFASMAISQPTTKERACLRAWLAFHDRLVISWLSEQTLKESEVISLTMRQLTVLCDEVLEVDCVSLTRNPGPPNGGG